MIDAINYVGTVWVRYFGVLVLQNSIFLLFVFLVLYVAEKVPARLKYTLAVIGLIKLILPPVLPAPFLQYLTIISEHSAAQVSLGTLRVLDPAAGGLAALTPGGILLLLWLLSVLVFMCIPVLSTCRLKRRLRDSAAIPRTEWGQSLDAKDIHLFQTAKIHLPLSFGLRSNRIYLPAFWKYWSPRCRRAVLTHELAHITRKDGTVQLLQYFIQALYFFHPLVWLLSARLNEYREMACDDEAVAGSEISAMEYSRYLVLLAEKVAEKGPGYTPASALIRQKNKLLKRVNYQMKEGTMRQISNKNAGLMYLFLIAMMLPLSWYCTGDKADEKPALPVQPQATITSDQESTDHQIFYAFDKRPEPVGGLEEIQRHLEYPEIARKAGIEGTVLIEVTINEEGNAVSTKVIKSLGNNGCDEAAQGAIRAVKWSPAFLGEKPVRVRIAIPVVFRLQGDKSVSDRTK